MNSERAAGASRGSDDGNLLQPCDEVWGAGADASYKRREATMLSTKKIGHLLRCLRTSYVAQIQQKFAAHPPNYFFVTRCPRVLLLMQLVCRLRAQAGFCGL